MWKTWDMIVWMADSQDPLFDAKEVFGDAEYDPDLLVEMVEEWLPSEEDVDPNSVYNARSVRWVGTPGQMFKISTDDIVAMQENEFDPVKVVTFAELIGRRGKPYIDAPTVMLRRVDLSDVGWSQEAMDLDELFSSYGTTRPYTTDDENLDVYLKNPDQYVEHYADNEEEEEELRQVMDSRAQEALASNDGDLGMLVAQLRDGNHRAFGAQLAGEDYIWVRVVQTDFLEDKGLSRDDLA